MTVLKSFFTLLFVVFCLFDVYAQSGDSTDLANTKKLAGMYADSGRFSQSVGYYQKALLMAEKTGNQDEIADIFFQLGIVFKKSGKPAEAIQNYRQAAEYYGKTNNSKKLADLYNKTGNAWLLMDDYDNAMKSFFVALQFAEETGDWFVAASAQNNIGITHNNLKNYTKAIEYYKNALVNFQKAGYPAIQGKIYNNIALIHLNQNQLDEAMEYLEQSLNIKQKHDDSASIVSTINNIGLVYEKKHNYAKALEKYQLVLKYFLQHSNKKELAISLNNVGFMYLRSNDVKNAEKYLNNSLNLANEIGSDMTKKIVYESLYKLHEQKKDFENAFICLQKYNQLNDSLVTAEKEKLIANIEARYENKKYLTEIEILSKNNALIQERNARQKLMIIGAIGLLIISVVFSVFFFRSRKKIKNANKILNEKNTEINQQRENLQELNNTKDKFFSIIAHDLKSPFNAIMGFSELLVQQVNEKEYDEIGQYANYILQSSEKAVSLLTNLMDWARSQTGRMEFIPEKFEMVYFIKAIVPIFDDIARQKSITIFTDLPFNIPAFADEGMISTVLRNLISNAIKFTKPGGEIVISAIQNQTEIVVSVKDNGVGIPQDTIGKLFRIDENYTTKGTNNERGTGLGLILCKEFVEKHGGKIWVESEEGEGSTFSFSLPAK